MSVKKLSIMLLLINVLEFLLGTGILISLQSNALAYSRAASILVLVMVLLSSLLSLGGLSAVAKYQKKTYQESLQDLENLNTRLREQRHDCMNQLQVTYGLLELGEYEEARDFLRPVFKDITKVNQALKTAQPAVNALLQAKLEAAESQGIDFYLEVGTQLKNPVLEPWELCKILANLIDNSVTAVSSLPGERKIILQIQEGAGKYRFLIKNNGPEIPADQQKLIFRKGYTTKKEEGHGMGLFIASSVLREIGESISLESIPGETAFSFSVPVGSPSKNDKWRGKLYK